MTSENDESHLRKIILRPFLKDGLYLSHNPREDSMAFLSLAFHGGKRIFLPRYSFSCLRKSSSLGNRQSLSPL